MKILIGRTDRIDFPEFGLHNIKCKIDTGAETSCIHCYKVKVNNGRTLSFKLLDPEHKRYNKKIFKTDHFDERVVKSSSGHAEMRYVIQSTIILFGKEFDIYLTLANRSEMRYPVLLGRSFLRDNGILVDVSKFNLSYNKKKK